MPARKQLYQSARVGMGKGNEGFLPYFLYKFNITHLRKCQGFQYIIGVIYDKSIDWFIHMNKMSFNLRAS